VACVLSLEDAYRFVSDFQEFTCLRKEEMHAFAIWKSTQFTCKIIYLFHVSLGEVLLGLIESGLVQADGFFGDGLENVLCLSKDRNVEVISNEDSLK
jgi:hypothetical protein